MSANFGAIAPLESNAGVYKLFDAFGESEVSRVLNRKTLLVSLKALRVLLEVFVSVLVRFST